MTSVPGNGGIFISYRRADTAANAGRLYDHLSDRFGASRVFMDIDSIAIGVDFTKAVIEAVSECDILLALIGRDWLTIADSQGTRRIDDPGDLVRVEIEAALQRDIRVVPVLVDGASLPRAIDLPPSLQPLVHRQALELSYTGFRSEVIRLIADVEKLLEAESRQSAGDPKISSRSTSGQHGGWKLELLADQGLKKTFRLSSGRETHYIFFTYGRIKKGDVTVDQEFVSHTQDPGQNTMVPRPLETLSSSLGCDVTIQYADSNPHNRRVAIKLLIVTIGDQVVRYES